MQLFPKPAADEYPPYAQAYISRTPAEGVTPQQLRDNLRTLLDLVEPLTDEQLLLRYAPDKWTLKEILLHLADSERVMAYRLLRIARNDTTPLPGFDQDQFNRYARANQRSKASLLREYVTVREASISLIESLDPNTYQLSGQASGHPVSVRGLVHFIAGHELHHLAIMRERYWPLL
jgi:uncharacterized damage-inducible protein DinB